MGTLETWLKIKYITSKNGKPPCSVFGKSGDARKSLRLNQAGSMETFHQSIGLIPHHPLLQCIFRLLMKQLKIIDQYRMNTSIIHKMNMIVCHICPVNYYN